MIKRFFFLMLVLLGLVFLFFKGLFLNPQELPLAQLDKPAPAFTLPLLDNLSRVVTEQDLKGHITVIHVWASWCASCKNELPLLMRIAQDKKIRLIGVNYRDQVEDAQQWLKNYGNPYEWTIFDPNADLGFNWGVYGTPETFIVDQLGVIRYRLSGPLSEKTVKNVLLRTIKGLEDE